MNIEIYDGPHDLLRKAILWERKHPYMVSFFFALLIVSYIVFFAAPLEMSEEDLAPSNNIVFLDIDKIQATESRRVTRKEVSATEGEVDPSKSEVDRAYGASDDPNAVDLAFQPNVVPPRPIGKLKKFYPQSAREKGVEAIINVELLIASNGRVKAVRVLGIRLSKALPPETHTEMAKAFARDAIKILQEVRFSPPVVQGRNVPVKFEMPLRFRLED